MIYEYDDDVNPDIRPYWGHSILNLCTRHRDMGIVGANELYQTCIEECKFYQDVFEDVRAEIPSLVLGESFGFSYVPPQKLRVVLRDIAVSPSAKAKIQDKIDAKYGVGKVVIE